MTTSDPAHVYQLDGSAWGPSGCMGAVGAMALDAYTGGAIRVGMNDIRAKQDDQSGGIGLDDVATAWRRGWKLTFTHGPTAWPTILSRLEHGDGVAITANYGALRSWRAPGSTFTGAHALYLSRAAGMGGDKRAGGIVVHDPLRRSAVTIPASVVQLAYTGGAGWGKGTYQGATTAGAGDAAKRAAALALLVAAGVPSSPDSYTFTKADAEKIAKLYQARRNLPDMLLPPIVEHWTGRTVADWVAESVAGSTKAESDPFRAIGDALAGLPTTLARSGLVLGFVVLALIGVWLTFREPSVVIPASVRRLA